MIERVKLVTLLKDWRDLDRKAHPLLSFIEPSVIPGAIWIGDYEVGYVYDDYVEFGGTLLIKDYGSVKVLKAADPEFFTKLDIVLKYLEGQLENIGYE